MRCLTIHSHNEYISGSLYWSCLGKYMHIMYIAWNKLSDWEGRKRKNKKKKNKISSERPGKPVEHNRNSNQYIERTRSVLFRMYQTTLTFRLSLCIASIYL